MKTNLPNYEIRELSPQHPNSTRRSLSTIWYCSGTVEDSTDCCQQLIYKLGTLYRGSCFVLIAIWCEPGIDNVKFLTTYRVTITQSSPPRKCSTSQTHINMTNFWLPVVPVFSICYRFRALILGSNLIEHLVCGFINLYKWSQSFVETFFWEFYNTFLL